MSTKTVYYAHMMSLYGSKQEARDIATIKALGFNVVNPNNYDVDEKTQVLRGQGRADNIMWEIFRPMVQGCDCLAFRAMPDGKISAGVATEIEYARQAEIPVFELPSMISRRSMSIEETREVLAELGQR